MDNSSNSSTQRTAVILPAYNEEGRIGDVLRVVCNATLVDEIIVVCDGCSDNTAQEARQALQSTSSQNNSTIFEMEQNIGKGGAMAYGAHRTDAEILLFLDADLIGLHPEHVDALLAPMLRTPRCEQADMTLGLFGTPRGGAFGWWLGWCHRVAACLTGQRAIRREVFFSIPELTRSRFGVEVAITRYVQNVWKLRVQHVRIDGVTHPIKEEKIGVWRGFRHRLNMYTEIAAYVIFDTIRHRTSTTLRQENSQIKERLNAMNNEP